jgi:hypothetical protein
VPARRAVLLALALLAALPAVADAKWYGSTMRGKANFTYGCSRAFVNGLFGPSLEPTNQRSCTYRAGGYVNSNRWTYLAPRNGRVTKLRIKSGKKPAKLQLTVLTGSSRVSTFPPYEDLPGTYTCCTARSVGKAFRPKANRISTKRVNVKLCNVRSGSIQHRIHSSDMVALSAAGKGSLPIHVRRDVGNYTNKTPLITGWWPRTSRGDPRVDGYSQAGLDLLMQWKFTATKRC